MDTLVLIGVGLIGGSFALDLKRHQSVRKVVGIDIDKANLARALERKVIDDAYTAINSDSIYGADMVLIASPVGTLPMICQQLAPVLPPQAIVSDVGSTKQSALAAFAKYLPQHYANCVAAHPIAGSDLHGASAAQLDLFKQKKCILCRHEHQSSSGLAAVAALWQAVGAQLYYLDAAEHDAIFAAVSHLPHVLAYAYMHQLAENPRCAELLYFAGTGFRDFTRIAGSHPAIWTDICLANRHELQTLLQQQQQQLVFLQQCLHTADADALTRFFQTAKNTREAWNNQQDDY